MTSDSVTFNYLDNGISSYYDMYCILVIILTLSRQRRYLYFEKIQFQQSHMFVKILDKMALIFMAMSLGTGHLQYVKRLLRGDNYSYAPYIRL